MNRNKEAKPDAIVTEMLATLNNFCIDKITEIINVIYNSGDIAKDHSISIFIVQLRKPGTNGCKLHRSRSCTLFDQIDSLLKKKMIIHELTLLLQLTLLLETITLSLASILQYITKCNSLDRLD